MELNEALDKLNKAGFVCEDVDITLEKFNSKVWDEIYVNVEINQYELIDALDERQERLVNNTIKDYWDNEYWPHKSVEDNIDACIKKIIDAVIDDM